MQVNDKHTFDISAHNNNKVFQELKSSEKNIRFLHRIIIIG
jgi:hypothetical protein